MSLPTADDLFRPTAASPEEQAEVETAAGAANEDDAGAAGKKSATARKRRTSGRVRHDEKMTVYVTADELLDIEHARLSLRREHGLAVDRGRLVREAIAIALAELDHAGEDSALVQRLTAS